MHMYISVPISQLSIMYFLAVIPQTLSERRKENSRSVWMLCVAQYFENWFSKQFEKSKEGENKNRVHHGSAEGSIECQRLWQHTRAPALESSHELQKAAGMSMSEYLQKAGLICSLLQLFTFKISNFSTMSACQETFWNGKKKKKIIKPCKKRQRFKGRA